MEEEATSLTVGFGQRVDIDARQRVQQAIEHGADDCAPGPALQQLLELGLGQQVPGGSSERCNEYIELLQAHRIMRQARAIMPML